MQSSALAPARLQLAIVAAGLLLAAYLPAWRKLWFVAENGHYGGGNSCLWLLLLGLYWRWQPARALTYAYLLLQLLVAGYILLHNLSTGGPTLGFVLVSGLNLAGLCTLHTSTALRHYLSNPPTNSIH